MNKNFAHDVSATTLEQAMLQLGQGANTNANSGVYKINDVTNMTKAGDWGIQRPSFDRESVHTTIGGQNLRSSSIIRSGRMILNGNFAGMYDFAYIDGNWSPHCETHPFSKMDAMLFSDKQDTHWALIYVNGDLELDGDLIIRPPCRKLGMCIYVSGDFALNGVVSMTDKGANHSGTGTSYGYTPPVAIPLNGTLTIPAAGGAGGARPFGSYDISSSGQKNNGVAADGSGNSNGTYCGSGGGGSGEARITTDYGGTGSYGQYAGAGSAGTCFTGGTGGGGWCWYDLGGGWQTGGANGAFQDSQDAITNGGMGGQCHVGRWSSYGNAPGAGNPGGTHLKGGTDNRDTTNTNRTLFTYEMGEQRGDNILNAPSNQMRHHRFRDGFTGTAGTCVIMVAGEYSGAGMVRSEGVHNNGYWDGYVGHGSSAGGGGIAIVLYGTDSSGPTPRSNGGEDDNYISAGGEGGAGTGLKAAL